MNIENICAGPDIASIEPISFNTERCIACNRCADVCQVDVLVPSLEKGKPPLVLFPGECWYCGCCVMECPTHAIRLRHPLMNQAHFRLKKELEDTLESE